MINTTAGDLLAQLSASTNAAEDMLVTILIGARVTNYVQSSTSVSAPGSPGSSGHTEISDIALPTATVTDIIFRGRTSSTSITAGYDEFHAYSMAVS